MSELASCHFADQAFFGTVEIAENRQVARDTFQLRFECAAMASRIVPGQFLMLRLSALNDPLLGRPMAMYDVRCDGAGRPRDVVVVYRRFGKMTHRLSDFAAGARLDVWGPLGNGFPSQPTDHLVMVAGGIGQTPFLALGQEFLGARRFGEPPRQVCHGKHVTLCYGARGAVDLACVSDFERAGFTVHIATDDGTAGHHGLVTAPAERVLDELGSSCRVVCCGPEKMMEAVAKLTAARGVACQVSLETPMACGIGICFSCVARVAQDDGTWDYRRTCVEGPVFDAAAIEF